ncbi:hypothetical protein O1611_g8058 [Lasiodiplodia mahajangana]|uniref:Uncharacterized protein n=1 Tax=Lasiodiplodia mahajangana TaxID=1108764 RepID=A0ACC2JDV5_9PEZI|nr:hypothetical protein O1611_g8058 [Lasiodiplodia mahajangana]
MSGLEIPGLVAAIVAAIFGGVQIVQNWQSNRRARQLVPENQALVNSLWSGRTGIQQRYDEDYRRLGGRYKRGDELQQIVITLLSSTSNAAAIVLPHVSSLLNRSNSMQTGVLDTLSSLYQRMAQANSMRLMPAPAQSSRSSSSLNFQDSQSSSRFCPDPSFAVMSDWKASYMACDQCSWKEKDYQIFYQVGPDWRMDNYAFYRSHAPDQKGMYICRVCRGLVKGRKGFLRHLDHHGVDKVKRAYGNNALTRTPEPDGPLEVLADGINRLLS